MRTQSKMPGAKLLGLFAAVAFAAVLSYANVARADDPIVVDGESIPRLADEPIDTGNQAAVDAFFAGFVAAPITDFRTAEAAEAAVGLALTNAEGDPIRLGRVAYVRPGLGNLLFSPAWVYLLAQHFDRVVVMYTNMTDPAPGSTDFRRIDELAGVPIPDAIAHKVKIFAIGSPNINLISFLQQSDVTLEQLEIIRRTSRISGRNLSEDAWIFAHSQGVPDATLTDHRLRAAGLPGFERIVAIAAAIKGGRLLESVIGQSFIDGAFFVAGQQGANAMALLAETATVAAMIEHLDIPGPDFAQKLYLDNRLASGTFAAFGGALDAGAPQGNVRDLFFSLTGIPDGDGEVLPNDGIEDFTSTQLARNTALFPQVDHILITEDPAILRAMLEVIDAALEVEEEED